MNQETIKIKKLNPHERAAYHKESNKRPPDYKITWRRHTIYTYQATPLILLIQKMREEDEDLKI